MRNVLANLGNIPVTSSVIASFFPEIKAKAAKISSLEKSGEIMRLRRNLFVLTPSESGTALSMGLIANHLLSPSYVSMHTALRHYGLIPEAVYTIQSMTFKEPKAYETPIGNFVYRHTPKEAYPIGLTQARDGDAQYIIATPEKALCDLIANTPGVNLRYQRDALLFLEADLRFDMERFFKFSPEVFERYAAVGKKTTSILTILKMLNNERHLR
jgi:predicted transcriptional regulator of viral defense system